MIYCYVISYIPSKNLCHGVSIQDAEPFHGFMKLNYSKLKGIFQNTANLQVAIWIL